MANNSTFIASITPEFVGTVVEHTVHDVRVMENSELKQNAVYLLHCWSAAFPAAGQQPSVFRKVWAKLRKNVKGVPSHYAEPAPLREEAKAQSSNDSKSTMVVKAKELIVRIYKRMSVWREDKESAEKYVGRVKSFQKKLLEEMMNDNKEKDLGLVLDILKELPLLVNKILGDNPDAEKKFTQLYKVVRDSFDNLSKDSTCDKSRCKSANKTLAADTANAHTNSRKELPRPKAANKSFLSDKPADTKASSDSSKAAGTRKRACSKAPAKSSAQKNKPPTPHKKDPVPARKAGPVKKARKAASNTVKAPHKSTNNDIKNVLQISISSEKSENMKEMPSPISNPSPKNNKESEAPLSLSDLIKSYQEHPLPDNKLQENAPNSSIALVSPSFQTMNHAGRQKESEEVETQWFGNEADNRMSIVSFAGGNGQEELKDKGTPLLSSPVINELGETLFKAYEEKDKLEDAKRLLENENMKLIDQYNSLCKDFQDLLSNYSYTKTEVAKALQHKQSAIAHSHNVIQELSYNKDQFGKLSGMEQMLSNTISSFEQQAQAMQGELEKLSRMEAELRAESRTLSRNPFKVAFKSVKMKKPPDSPGDPFSSESKDVSEGLLLN